MIEWAMAVGFSFLLCHVIFRLLAVSLLSAAGGHAAAFCCCLLLAVTLVVPSFGFACCSFWFGCVQSMTAWVIASAHVLVAVGRRMFITDRVIATLSIRTKTSISHL